jgi:HAD superfamily hydrolase (TIGR01549 family)
MTLTLLFDLDDTLLNNDINKFLPEYLKLLGKHLAAYVAPENMVANLLGATRVMMSNNSAALSLEQSFDQVFYPAIGQTKEGLRDVLAQFYEDIFPQLQGLTSPRPEAQAVVEYATQKNHTLVVATNPLFPRRAIVHRLSWAGFPTKPFAVITTYEHFHFAKPNPAYFAEILAQLGWPRQTAVVIGNSLEDDLVPAAKLGLPVYWVSPSGAAHSGAALPEGFHPLSDAGSLADVPAWIEKVEAAEIQQAFHTPSALIPVVKATPAALDTLAMDLTERQWQDRPAPTEWSLTEVLCHLRDVDREVNIPRIEKIASGNNPFLPGVNSDTWAEERNYRGEDGRSALRGFIEVRTRLVDMLQSLEDTGWRQPARHAIFGPTTLLELVSFIATHDQTHIQQAQAAVRALY